MVSILVTVNESTMQIVSYALRVSSEKGGRRGLVADVGQTSLISLRLSLTSLSETATCTVRLRRSEAPFRPGEIFSQV